MYLSIFVNINFRHSVSIRFLKHIIDVPFVSKSLKSQSKERNLCF